MILARLTLLALLGWAAGPDPAALVGDLASPRDPIREEAAGALEELGRPALPALYRAREADDPDLRRRVEPLIDLIERQRLLRATKVRLDFEDRPLSEVVEALGAQTGFPLVVGADDALRSRRVTLRADEPVPFWEALDRVGATCRVRHNPGIPWSPPPREPTILLGPAEGPPVPASDAGPFRVYLVRLARHREVTPARAPARAKSFESLTADLQVIAEPGLAVNRIGPVALDEVVDDRGRDLRPDPPVGLFSSQPWPPRFEEGRVALFAVSIPLRSSSGPGRQLRRLKGYIPVSVVARTGDPIVVPLVGAEGKTFSRDGLALRVTGVGRVGEDMTLTLTIRGEQARRMLFPELAIPLGDFRPLYRVEDHVQIQDDRGRVLWWSAGPLRDAEGGGLETQLTIYQRTEGPPARVLYHGVVGAASEVVFEFADLPLP